MEVFGALWVIFSSNSVQTPSALRALHLVTRLEAGDVSAASYKLFKSIMGYDSLTDQHWEAARLAIHGAFREDTTITRERLGGLKEILKFLGHHISLQGTGEDHGSSIEHALDAVVVHSGIYRADPMTVECIGDFNRTSKSFVRGVRSMMRPDSSPATLQWCTVSLIALTSEQWFRSPIPIMEPEEMSEFCEHIAVYIIDEVRHGECTRTWGLTILFEMLHSPECRKYIIPRFWSMLAHCPHVKEEWEPFRWCLQNAIELLEFTRGLPDGEGLKWWYCTLWFHYDKLDTTVRDEVGRIAGDMSSGDGLADLNLYINLIGQEVTRVRQEIDELPDADRLGRVGMAQRAQLVALEENHNRLAQITGRRRI